MLAPPLQFVLALLRIAAALALLGPGLHKIGWIAHPALDAQLQQWITQAHNPLVLKYLNFMLPHANLLARIVVAGELGLGTLLLFGFLTPLAAVLGFLMVANFHFASGAMLSLDYLTGQDGLVFLFIFPVLLLGRAGSMLGVDGFIGRKMASGGGKPGGK
ncbi:MAG: DoxX family membrane protein [Deltaproteobacteria bacterium]|nr:DoxX family membrane protein [Deltaproteobacteria bacterium]